MWRTGIAALTLPWLVLTVSQPIAAETIYGIDRINNLITFDSATPGTLLASHTLTGLVNGDVVRDIDIRPADGKLYGLGFSQTSGSAAGIRFYTIDPTTGFSVLVSTSSPAPAVGPIDFDPVSGQLRMVVNAFANDPNMLIDVDTGQTTAQGMLAYASDDPRRGLNPAVTGIAYTNNSAGATSTTTTLYAIQGSAQDLVTISPPETGILHTVGSNGVPTPSGVAFDISGLSGIAYLEFENTIGQQLYTVNLQTGSATLLGTIADNQHIYGIAVPVGAAVPEPRSILLICTGPIGAGVAAWRRTRVAT